MMQIQMHQLGDQRKLFRQEWMKDLFHKMLENWFKHNICFLFILCCRCICNARPLAHPVRWGSVSESRPAVDHPNEGTTCSATAATSKPCYVWAADGHARFWPWHSAHGRPAGEEGPRCHRGALTSEQHTNNQSPLYTEKLEDEAKKSWNWD